MAIQLTLGITTIGDLLLENKITSVNNDEPVENLILSIPAYQRPYKWTTKNALQLFEDINEAMNGNKDKYRVGTLILHYDDKDGGFNIVDGQQRIITFALLLRCLKPAADIRFLEQQLTQNPVNLYNVLNNFRALERRIRRIDDQEKLTGYIEKHCELIIVITDDQTTAFQFFDSQNARGKTLYPHDLLKAYHLREMNNLPLDEVERIVKMWEELDQKKLSYLFNDYLYRLKQWINGNVAYKLTEQNIDIFKGVTARDNYPYAQYYKGAYAYADKLNSSNVPFVTGIQSMSPFQVCAPIIAGKPFFEYTKHYFDILEDIQNNDKYEGDYINDNPIIKTLDLKHYKKNTGDLITRLMLDTAILLYVDRFCPPRPSRSDLDQLNQFVSFSFIWAYSMRAQYQHVGWLVAQNYIMGVSNKKNSFNIYKIINEADSPAILLSSLADMLLPIKEVSETAKRPEISIIGQIQQNYLQYFIDLKFLEGHYGQSGATIDTERSFN